MQVLEFVMVAVAVIVLHWVSLGSGDLKKRKHIKARSSHYLSLMTGEPWLSVFQMSKTGKKKILINS